MKGLPSRKKRDNFFLDSRQRHQIDMPGVILSVRHSKGFGIGRRQRGGFSRHGPIPVLEQYGWIGLWQRFFQHAFIENHGGRSRRLTTIPDARRQGSLSPS